MKEAKTRDYRRHRNEPIEAQINFHLLRCVAHLTCDSPEEGLEEATDALNVAISAKMYHMQSKAQFYRGLCFKRLKKWKRAQLCFVSAANVRGWAKDIPRLGKECDLRICGGNSGTEEHSFGFGVW